MATKSTMLIATTAAVLGAFALGVAAIAGPATASILNWNLENVLFDDGGQASGTFSVDTTTGAVTAFDITTTTGSILAGFHYDGATGFAGGDLLSGVRLFDLYHGNQIPAGTKSLAYALSYQAADRTLADKEIDKAHKKIEDRLKHVLQAQIRGRELPT